MVGFETADKMTKRQVAQKVRNFARADCGPVAHRIIVKEVSQTPPPPPIIVSHMCAPMKTNADYSESEEIAWRRK